MFVSSHMYYSKTFIAGQFSPDYWEVKLYDVLEAHDTGKIVDVDAFTAKTDLHSAIQIDILGLDNVSISNEISANPLSIGALSDTTLSQDIQTFSISGLEIDSFSYDLRTVLEYSGLSVFTGNEQSVTNDSYESKLMSGIGFSTSNIEENYVGNSIYVASLNSTEMYGNLSNLELYATEVSYNTLEKSGLDSGEPSIMRDNNSSFYVSTDVNLVNTVNIYNSTKLISYLDCTSSVLPITIMSGVFNEHLVSTTNDFL